MTEAAKLIKQDLIRAHQDMPDNELLGWAMNQLFRAARQMEMCSIGATLSPDAPAIIGSDACAEVILARLASTPEGWRDIEETNPGLLKGLKKPS